MTHGPYQLTGWLLSGYCLLLFSSVAYGSRTFRTQEEDRAYVANLYQQFKAQHDKYIDLGAVSLDIENIPAFGSLSRGTITQTGRRALLRRSLLLPPEGFVQPNGPFNGTLASSDERCSQEDVSKGTYITNTQEAPFRWVGELYSPAGDRCTGSLIGPCHVLTAAHCVYISSNNTLQEDWLFVPGVVGTTATHGVQQAVSVKADVAGDMPASFDIALVVLDKCVGNTLGHFKFSAASQGLLPSASEPCLVNYAGYHVAGNMYYDYCQKLGELDYQNLVGTSCYAGPGASGGPMWVYDRDSSSRTIQAVLTSGYPNGPSAAVRFSPSLAATISTWIAEHPC